MNRVACEWPVATDVPPPAHDGAHELIECHASHVPGVGEVFWLECVTPGCAFATAVA